MIVFSNKACNVKSLQNIRNKEYLLWLEKMYENCIQNCNEEDTIKMDTFLEIRDAITMKISSLDREERMKKVIQKKLK